MSEEQLVSTNIPNQIPSFIREDYSRFVQFIQDVYACDERRGASLDILRNILTYKDTFSFDSFGTGQTSLHDDIDSTTTDILLNDASSFPANNGVVLIDNEIVLYRTRNNDLLVDCIRGSSYMSTITEIFETPDYTYTVADSHESGTVVYDLTILAIRESLNMTYKTFADNFNDELIYSGIRRSTVLNHISSFYRSKGSENGITILLKLLYGNVDVTVFYPGDRVLRCSDSSWYSRSIIRCEVISGDIDGVRDNVLYQFNGSYNNEFLVEEVRPIFFFDREVYEITINELRKIGNVIPSTKTNLKETIDPTDTVLTVDSTYGFPDNTGVITIGTEHIGYSYATCNQFHICNRGLDDTGAQYHEIGTEVYVDYPLISYTNTGEVVLRCLNVVSTVDCIDGGILNVPDTFISSGTGITNTNIPIIDVWQENINASKAQISQLTVSDIGSFPYGVSSVHYDDNNVFVQTTSLPPTEIGPFGEESAQDLVPLSSTICIPRSPRTTTDKVNVGVESIGVFVDGVLAQSHGIHNNLLYGAVETIDVRVSGNGYISAPHVIISGGNGSGCTATSTVENGIVKEIDVTSGGSGYTDEPSVRLSTGEDCVIIPQFDRYGRMTSIVVQNGGRYYLDTPTIRVVDPNGRGVGALLTIDPNTIVDGVIQTNSVIINNPGIDYSSATYIIVDPVGSGAEASANVYTYTYDSVLYVSSSSVRDFDNRNGYVYPRRKGSGISRNTYCYSNDPIALRQELNDDGTEHSPILGWALDGNPIYGPYAYENPMDTTTDVIRMTSSYQLRTSRIGASPPSEVDYPLGTFIEDYEYVDESGTLDIHNGRFCITPDFPLGVYAYFITLDGSLQPQFPYIIGPTFRSLPISQNIDFMGNYTRNTYGYTSVLNERYYGEEGAIDYDISKIVRNFNTSNNQLYTLDISGNIDTTSNGTINDVYVDYSDGTYCVGDLCRFNYVDGIDRKCEAVVDWVVGADISSLAFAIPPITVILRDQTVTFDTDDRTFTSSDIYMVSDYITFSSPHELTEGNRVLFTNVNGDLPDGLEDGRCYFVDYINNNTIRLCHSLNDLANGVYVNFYSSGSGDKKLSPVYTFGAGRTIYTENGCEFTTTDWDVNTATLSIHIDGKIDISTGDRFRDFVGSTVVVKLNTITTPDISQDDTLIPVTDSAGFYGGDVIRVGNEVMTIVNILPNNILEVNRTDPPHDDIPSYTSVTNLTRLAIIVDTFTEHKLVRGDDVDIVGAIPTIFNGRVKVGTVINPTRFVCFKLLSKLDILFILNEPIPGSPIGSAYTTSTRPYFLTNPQDGTLWWSALSGLLYVYYHDADTEQWVMVTPTGIVPTEIDTEMDFISITENTPVPSGGGNIVTGGVIQICEVAPSTRIDLTDLENGDLWWSSLIGYLFIYYEGSWIPTTPTGDASRAIESAVPVSPDYSPGSSTQRYAVVTISENPPVDGVEPVSDGDLWWSSLSGFLYIRYDSEWVIATPVGTVPGEGASEYSISNVSNILGFEYIIISVATGSYFFATKSEVVIGRIHGIQVTSQGDSLPRLPFITGVYPKAIDRSEHAFELDDVGSFVSVSVVSGGKRYSNPSVEVITSTGYGAQFNVNSLNGTITSIDVLSGGIGYSTSDSILIIDTENVLVPTTNTIGSRLSTKINTIGCYQNSDPTIVPELELTLSCTLIDVNGNFDLNSTVTSRSGNFSGIVESWDANTRILTMKNVNGYLVDGDVIDSLFIPPADSEDFGLVTEDEEDTEDYGSVPDVVDAVDDWGLLYEYFPSYATVLQSGQSKLVTRTAANIKLSSDFLTSRGVISSSYPKIIDSYYYQNFSYVIDSEVRTEEYRPFVIKNIHPAGYLMFGRMSLRSPISTYQCVVDSEVVVS